MTNITDMKKEKVKNSKSGQIALVTTNLKINRHSQTESKYCWYYKTVSILVLLFDCLDN